MRSRIKSVPFLSAASATFLACTSSAIAKQSFVVIPDQHAGNAPEIGTAAGGAYNRLGPGDGLTVLNAVDGELVVSFTVAENGRYRLREYIDSDYAQEKQQILSALEALVASSETAPSDVRSDIPAIISSISNLRSMQSGAAHALIIASPLHVENDDVSASMLDADGAIRIPSDALLQGSTLLSPYGLNSESGALKGVVFHFCAVMPKLKDFEESEIARVWAHYVSLRGGVLATFTRSLSTCVQRFEAKVSTPLNVRPLQNDTQAAMISAARSTEISQTTVDERADIQDQLTREKIVNAAKVSALELQLDHARADNTTLVEQIEVADARLSDCNTNLQNVSGELSEINAALSAGHKLDGVTTFTRFQEVKHSTRRDIGVFTGVSYEQEHFPRFERSWCYFNIKGQNGLQLRIDIGDKDFGKAITWDRPNNATLNSAGVSLTEFSAARQSCRFPSQ